VIESIFFNPWIWIVAALLLASLVVSIISLVMGIGRWGEMSTWWLGFIISTTVFAVLGGAFFGAILPPYDSSFYQTYRITGEVTKVEAAFNGDEGTMSQVFVAKVDGVDEFIRSDDQRFRTLEVGDEVNLVCSKEFRYFQEPWYECAFGGIR